MLKGKAETIENYETYINDNTAMPTPSVIKLTQYVAVPYRELPFSKKNILIRDKYTCQYCGKKSSYLTLDHVFPKSRGGATSWENIVAACPKCNCKKANKTPKEAGMKLLNEPKKPKGKYNYFLIKNSYEQWNKYLVS
ncbi:MAG: HNH endonuclease [Candidatus Gastranaerophilales bacterium]|nr:HNH endonuclease [Candidatus Gastranaerophilales bacterium]